MLGNAAGNSTGTAVTPGPQTATEKSRLDQILSHDFTSSVLAYGITIGFFALIFLLLVFSWRGSGTLGPTGPLTPDAAAPAGTTTGAFTNGPFHDLLNTLVGIVGTAWATIVAFYFGSSSGSRQQLQTLSQVALEPGPASSRPPPGTNGQAGGTGPASGRTGPGPTGPTGTA